MTLRHLLGFTSGFSGGVGCGGLDLAECTRQMYTTNTHSGLPGERFAYNEVHLQLAAGVAEAAVGRPFAELAREWVFDPAGGMPSTSWNNVGNPAAGAGLTSTPRDYRSFMHSYFNHELISTESRTAMETDQYPQAARSAADGGWHYGLANWFVCPDDNGGQWCERCVEEDVHQSGALTQLTDPRTHRPTRAADGACHEYLAAGMATAGGAAGFRPTTDRRHNYWYQIAHEGIPGVSNTFTLQLHYVLKPLIDANFESFGYAAATSHYYVNGTAHAV